MKTYIRLLQHITLAVVMLFLWSHTLAQQTLSLTEAISLSVKNFQTIQAKALAKQAAQAELKVSKTLYLPDFTLSTQQYYGTANGTFGPQYNFGEGMNTMGAIQSEQTWSAAFSSLYLANFNWTIFAFGAHRNSIKLAKKQVAFADADWEQTLFEHQIKVASVYLNAVAINELVKVQQKNVERAKVVLTVATSLTSSGIRPEVERSTAEAEEASANIALLKAQDQQAELLKELSVMIGVPHRSFVIDERLTTHLPKIQLLDSTLIYNHPALRTKEVSIEMSEHQQKIFLAQALPKVQLVGSVAGRGSGFQPNYSTNQQAFSSSYTDGVGIHRANYVVGIGLSWNITSFAKNRYKSTAQHYTTQSLQQERDLVEQELQARLQQASEKIAYTHRQYLEVQKQTNAATQSHQQYESLYRSGLAVVDELIQATYQLARAESDRAIIQINVWQAHLLEAASSGTIEHFINQLAHPL
ncbi:MAG: TolC family protein [Bacteroidales bacterium]